MFSPGSEVVPRNPTVSTGTFAPVNPPHANESVFTSVYFAAFSLLNLNLSNFKVNGKEGCMILGQDAINDKPV